MGTADIGASRPGAGGFNQSYLNLQRRIHESMRDVRNINSRHTSRHNTIFNNQNLNMFSNFGNDDGGIIGGIGGMGGLGGLNAGFGSNGGLAAAAGELGMLFFNSPCKIFYSVNDSEWSDGVDINLMNQKRAPLNLVVTMPPEMPKLSKSPQASQHQANATTSLDPASEAAEQAPQTPDNPTITDSNPELHNAEDTH